MSTPAAPAPADLAALAPRLPVGRPEAPDTPEVFVAATARWASRVGDRGQLVAAPLPYISVEETGPGTGRFAPFADVGGARKRLGVLTHPTLVEAAEKHPLREVAFGGRVTLTGVAPGAALALVVLAAFGGLAAGLALG